MSEDTRDELITEGQRLAWWQMLNSCLRNLGYSEETQSASLIAEREAAVIALRSLCNELGDNDWPANLHLADIVDKHVRPHIE